LTPVPPAGFTGGMREYGDLLDYYTENDRVLALSLTTVRRLKGEAVESVAREILGYLTARGIENPAARYSARTKELFELQNEFERTGHYRASSYAEVPQLDREEYNLGLLLSFIATLHRFEILERLREFYCLPCGGPKRLLTVGFGTGYELRHAFQLLQGWEHSAFDTSPEARAYATDLLRFFGCPVDRLTLGEFPLETEEGQGEYAGCFGKIVLCELLEHLEAPDRAIASVGKALHPDGHAFLTMAVNIAQEDHIFLYQSPGEARRQVEESGLLVLQEWLAPVTVLPFAEEDREKIFRRGNYICVAAKA